MVMKKIGVLWVIGLVAMVTVLLGQGTASAIPFQLTVSIAGGDSVTVSGTGYLAYTGMLDGWYINEYVTSTPGNGTNLPDTLSLTSDNTSPGAGKLTVKVTQVFAAAPSSLLLGVASATSTFNDGTMAFTSSVDSVTGGLGPFKGVNFNQTGTLTSVANASSSYNATLDYTLTNSGKAHDLVDDYTLSVSTSKLVPPPDPDPHPIPTPEPATLLLLGSGLAGLVGLGALRRR